jgi:transcriptional regulator with XRE-family HTH domain
MAAVPKDTQSPLLRKVGVRIKTLREARGWSQQQLATRSGVNRVYLSGIERGIRNFTILHLAKLTRALKVTAGSLIDD